MNDLALAAFAAETGGHVVEEPKERRFARFRRTFDSEGFRASLDARGLRFLGRSEPSYPRLLRELHDPPPGLFLPLVFTPLGSRRSRLIAASFSASSRR